MSITITSEQVLALAPDPASASAGKKLAGTKDWSNLGQNDLALWGECQGSAMYQVRVDLGNYSVKCSCPSRKFPCKHGLGLMLMAVNTPAVLPTSDPPEWVASWLAKRVATAEKREERAEKAPKAVDSPPTADQQKRIAKRQALILQGLDALDLWMNDLVRAGLATVERESASFWEHQAKRLVDAQAPGVATLLRQMGEIPGATPDWPTRLLARMGRVALLTQAYRRLDALALPMQDELRQLIGWNLTQDEVTARGELVEDDWLIVGQWAEEESSHAHITTQRTWLLGAQTERPALILQFSVMNRPYPEVIVPGMRLRGGLRFYPGVAPVRAIIEARQGESPLIIALPGQPTITAFLRQMAEGLAQQPWQQRRLCVLNQVVPVCAKNGDCWWVRDQSGDALRLIDATHWRLLALSGGAPVDLAGEWDGEALRPLGVLVNERYYLVGGTA